MFDDLRKSVFSGETSNFDSQAANIWYGKDSYNQPPISYGYPSGNAYKGYVPPAPDVTISQELYKYDALNDRWCKEVANSKGKIKITPLTGGFTITCKYKNITPEGDLRFAIIRYGTKGREYYELIPKDDYIKDAFHKYLKEIYRFPGCTKSKFNALVTFLLQTVPTQDIIMFDHQGWQEFAGGSLNFAFNPSHIYIPQSLISPSVARRKVKEADRSPQEVIQRWKDFISKNPSLMFMGYYRLGSLLQYFLYIAGIKVRQFLIVEPSDDMGKDKIVATLATNDTVNFPVPTLGAGEDVIIKEQEYVYDGVAVYTDDCFADEEKAMIAGLKCIIRTVKGETTNQNLGNGLTAVVSKNAAYAATRIAPENVIVINTDGVEVEADAETIKSITSEMDTLAIKTIASNFTDLIGFISSFVPKLRGNLSAKTDSNSLDTLTMIVFVESFLFRYFGFRFMGDDDFHKFIESVDCKSDRCMSAAQAIEKDFYSILSKMLRSKSISPVPKRRGMCFDDDGRTFMLDGDRIYLTSKIVNAILTQMTTTHSLESLMKALKHTKALEATDGNAHPVEVHDSMGEYQRLYMYDISAEILNSSDLYKLHNLENESFLLSKVEVPKDDFITILKNSEGYVAGKQICYKDEENGHFYVTGQSGWGKTYLLCQLLAKCFKLGHRVVVFDSSDSFTYEALCRNLSKRFVDQNVTIYDLDKEGIPIDLFGIDSNASLPSKKKFLLGIMQAGIGELSVPQSNVLRSILSNVISECCNNSISYSRIGEALKRGGKSSEEMTYDSLMNRIEPLFEDIDECGMAEQSWNKFLRDSNNIVVIRTDSASTQSGNQLIDMMLATLFNYQHDNPQVPLDVFIDEIQNQNFSETSPIRKIMKEGRKSHMSFFGATQDYYPRNTELGSVMGKAGTQIFLRPTPNSTNVVAAELRFSKAEIERFDGMMRGDLIVKANLFNKELGRNVPTTISGHVDDYPKIPDNYYGNVL